MVLNNPNKLDRDTWVDFKIELIDDNGDPIVLPVSYWSVFDLEGPQTKPESVRLRKDEVGNNVYLDEDNPLQVIDDGEYVQYQAQVNHLIDNPKTPDALTDEQKEISVGFKLQDSSSFYLGYQNVNAARNAFIYAASEEVLSHPMCDIDDCPNNECDQGECIDGLDSYTCECDDGFEGEMCDIIIETCDDGIQNQDETGIDCGGVCPPCACSAYD
eukprot:UN29290